MSMKKLLTNVFISCITILIFSCSCSEDNGHSNDVDTLNNYDESGQIPFAYEGITDLKRGDIIIRSNSNILPRTAYLEDGWGFGHAAIVTRGASGEFPDSILANAYVFESHAQPVPQKYQLREVKGLDINENPFLHNESFSPRYTGSRYRLRLNISEEEIERIIDFIVAQEGDLSSWNAMKRFPGNPEIEEQVKDGRRDNWADNSHWYCSLLIWQAVFYVTGIDLDNNGGYFVYPNDIVVSHYFNNSESHIGRARF